MDDRVPSDEVTESDVALEGTPEWRMSEMSGQESGGCCCVDCELRRVSNVVTPK